MAYEPVIYSPRARTEGEAVAHLVIRRTFLRHVVTDARTRLLFKLWGLQTGIDDVIAHMRELLEAAATRAGLRNRAQLREPAHANVSFGRSSMSKHCPPIVGRISGGS